MTKHPMIPQLGSHQMSGLFDDIYAGLKQAGQGVIDNAKESALATVALSVVNDKAVQEAIVKKGEQAAYQQIIDNLVAGRQALTGFAQENPYKSAMIVGGGVIAIGLIIYLLRK